MSQYLGRQKNKSFYRNLQTRVDNYKRLLEKQAKEMLAKQKEDESKEIIDN